MSTPSPESVESTVAQITERIRRINEAWVKNRLEDYDDLFHQDIVFELPGFAGRLEGRAACVESYREFNERSEVECLELQEPTVKVWGQTAVATYEFDVDYEMDGENHRDAGTDAYVFSFEGGRWWAVWRVLHYAPQEDEDALGANP